MRQCKKFRRCQSYGMSIATQQFAPAKLARLSGNGVNKTLSAGFYRRLFCVFMQTEAYSGITAPERVLFRLNRGLDLLCMKGLS